MPAEKSLEEVLEDHRRKRGATSISISLAPGANPEEIEKFLESVRREEVKFYTYSQLERSQAYAARLKNLLREVRRLACVDPSASEEELRDRMTDISLKADLIVDVHFEKDIAFMEAAREKAAAE
ncbi:hypothetical protein [Salipiger mucosus]|uniref:hypothetical protein n=1 Tax=Salipiger mucosus TaxID=263378 RepID=UPI0012EC1456|nr:hypothetical protein [Salipiger mucosus]